jgi:hypothetical protein
VQILAMMHRSRDEALDRYESINAHKASAADTLAQWKTKGCNEKFRIFCRVPKGLIQ